MAVFLSNYVFPTRYSARHPNSRRPNSVTDLDFSLYYPLLKLSFAFVLLVAHIRDIYWFIVMACVLYITLIFHCVCKLIRTKCLNKINHAEGGSSDINNASRQGKRRSVLNPAPSVLPCHTRAPVSSCHTRVLVPLF